MYQITTYALHATPYRYNELLVYIRFHTPVCLPLLQSLVVRAYAKQARLRGENAPNPHIRGQNKHARNQSDAPSTKSYIPQNLSFLLASIDYPVIQEASMYASAKHPSLLRNGRLRQPLGTSFLVRTLKCGSHLGVPWVKP